MPTADKLGFVEQGRGAPLCLVHGFPLDARMWAEQLAGLSDSRRVIAVDLRGRGKSRELASPDYDLDTHADDLAVTLTSLGIDRVDVGGLSMGGYVAMAFLRRHPDRVRSLLLLSTRAAADTEEGKRGRLETAERIRREGTGPLADSMLPKLLAASAPESLRARVRAMIEETPIETAAQDCLAMRARPDSTEMLAKTRVPVLVLHGEQDPLTPLATAKATAGAIPKAVFAPVSRAAHLPPLENPAAANAAIRQFLDRLS